MLSDQPPKITQEELDHCIAWPWLPSEKQTIKFWLETEGLDKWNSLCKLYGEKLVEKCYQEILNESGNYQI